MPGTKRKGAPKYHGAGNTGIRRRKIYRPMSAPSRRRGGVATSNPLDRCFIKVTKLSHAEPSSVSNRKIFGAMKMSELGNTPRFLRYASMYSYYKVHKIKTTFNTRNVAVAISSFDPDSDHVPTDQQQLTAHLNCCFHKLKEVGTNSRTVNLQKMSKFQDFNTCQGAGPMLATEKMKATIQYCFPEVDAASDFSITVFEEWIVEFRGMRDVLQLTAINNPALTQGMPAGGGNGGPTDPVPQGMEP